MLELSKESHPRQGGGSGIEIIGLRSYSSHVRHVDDDWYACFGDVLCRWLTRIVLADSLESFVPGGTADTERHTKMNVDKRPSGRAGKN